MVAQKILERFENGEFDVATLFYSRFKSIIAQIPTAQQIIPAEIAKWTRVAVEAGMPRADK